MQLSISSIDSLALHIEIPDGDSPDIENGVRSMPSLQKLIADTRELDVTELDQVTGGSSPLTSTSYTDSHGTTHTVSNRDINSD